ncbi:MAG: trypsin-like serine protease [Planctomycetales bacterium]|nr:trypsin-like serine protease [Planctomycetales bacterium]
MRVFLLAAVVALSVYCGSVRPVAAALTVNGYTPATAGMYDRFDDDPNFIGSAYDWSGVGRTAGGRWGVLISPSFVLSAAHYPPALGDTIRFYASNNPGGAFESRLIDSSVTITDTGIGVGSDLLLTRLSAPVVGIANYAIGNPASGLVGEELFVWGQDNNANAFLNTRLGRNVVTEVAPAFTAPKLVGTGDVFVYDYNTTSGLGADEAKVVTGDSGGPSFIVGPDGNLALVGIHWFEYSADPAVPGSLGGSGDTLVTSFIDELNTAMANMGSLERVTVAVPEPSALGLCVVGLSAVCFRRRSRAQALSSIAI